MNRSRIRRRTFLRAADVATGALSAPAIAPSRVLGKDVPSEKITVGFIGTGNNGTNWISPFLGDSRVRVVAVCDVNKEGGGYWGGSVRGREPARRKVDGHYGEKSCAAYADFRDLIARKDTVAPIEVGHRSISIAHLGNIALRTGRDIRWNPEREEILNDAGASALLGRKYRAPWKQT